MSRVISALPFLGMTGTPNAQIPWSFDLSGRHLAYTEVSPSGGTDIMILPIDGDEKSGWKFGTPVALLNTPAVETSPTFSPDGRWIAYVAGESGSAMDVYVRPFPSGNGKWKISAGGGTFPQWSLASPELFYSVPAPQVRLMSVTYTADGESFRADTPRQWSNVILPPWARSYAVHPDGLRVLTGEVRDIKAEPNDKAVFVLNFFEELRRAAPLK